MSSEVNANKTTVELTQSVDRKFIQKPKRPMTAYNFFFQEERRRILAGEDPETAPAILASKNNGSATGLSSSRKQRQVDFESIPHDKNGDRKSQKRLRDGNVKDESITFEGLGRIIGKRWKKKKNNGDISKYTSLAKKASVKYKEDIKRYYDEEMESMLRMGRNIETVAHTEIKTQMKNGSFEQRSNLNDLPHCVNLYNKQDGIKYVQTNSIPMATLSDSELAHSQRNVAFANSRQNTQHSPLLMDNQASMLTYNIDPHKILNSSFGRPVSSPYDVSILSQPNTVPQNFIYGNNTNNTFWQQQPSLSIVENLIDRNNVFSEPTTTRRDAASITTNSRNLENILLPLDEISPPNMTRYERISMLLEELNREHLS